MQKAQNGPSNCHLATLTLQLLSPYILNIASFRCIPCLLHVITPIELIIPSDTKARNWPLKLPSGNSLTLQLLSHYILNIASFRYLPCLLNVITLIELIIPSYTKSSKLPSGNTDIVAVVTLYSQYCLLQIYSLFTSRYYTHRAQNTQRCKAISVLRYLEGSAAKKRESKLFTFS